MYLVNKIVSGVGVGVNLQPVNSSEHTLPGVEIYSPIKEKTTVVRDYPTPGNTWEITPFSHPGLRRQLLLLIYLLVV